jgi:tetratricopeptide (TPR) repeat protein
MATHQFLELDRFDDALRLLDAAIIVRKRQNDEQEKAICIGLRGEVRGAAGDIGRARREYEQALSALEKGRDQRPAAIIQLSWANTALQHGLLEEAGYQYVNAGKTFKRLGDSGSVSTVSHNFSIFLEALQDQASQFGDIWEEAGLPVTAEIMSALAR